MSEPDQKNKKSCGVILKEARGAKGLSLSMIHEATKIPLDVLKAIEEGYNVRMLTPFYEKAFTKKYAEYLGVDITGSFQDIRREKKPDSIKGKKIIRPMETKTDTFLTRDRQRQIVKFVGALLILFLIGRIVGCLGNNRRRNLAKKAAQAEQKKKASVKKKEATKENKVPAPKKERKVAVPEPPKPVPIPKEPPRPAITKKVSLTIKAKKKVWLQVKVDGNTVFQSTLKAGVRETWQADKSIELSGRNINYLEFEVNGEILGTLGRADRQARRVIITKEGLSVKK